MKSFYLYFIVSFFISITCFSQKKINRITYNVSLNINEGEIENRIKNKKELNNKNKELKSLVRKMFKNSKDIISFLEFNSSSSVYFIENKINNESEKGINLTKNRAGGERIFFTELFSQKNLEQECKLLGECFFINNEYPKWEITQETKMIGGYKCFKALNLNSKNKKTSPIAWFSPDLPYGFGPLSFRGLPGVILELTDNFIIFKAIKIELNLIDIKEVKKVKNGKEVTRKKYKEILKKTFSEFYNKD